MKVLLLLCALAGLAGGPARAWTTQAGPAAQVGVDEKLGTQVPADLVLNDENGAPVRLGSLIDKPTVLTLNYFRCAGICTPLLNGVADVIGQVQARPGQDFRVLTVSFDPADTPEIARTKQANYLKEIKRPIAPAAWRFLTGGAGPTRTLCDTVGFKFMAQGDGFIHSGVILVLSPQGKVTRYMYGVSFQPADLEMALQEAARGETRPTVNHLLQFCFSVDPQSHALVFSITKAATALTFLFAAVFLAFLLFKKKAQGVKP